MIRNSTMYRRLWYVRRRNGGKIHIISRILIIILIFISLTTYANRKLFPYLIVISENKVESIINKIVRNAVGQVFTEEQDFDNLIITNKDQDGQFVSIDTNVAKLNRISVKISSIIYENLSNLGSEKISIPFGVLLGNSIFASMGPELFISIQPYGSVETEFKSEYTLQGDKRTKYVLYLQVKTKAGIKAPLFLKKSEIITNVPVIETIIISED
jgi:sporulation protein YunB